MLAAEYESPEGELKSGVRERMVDRPKGSPLYEAAAQQDHERVTNLIVAMKEKIAQAKSREEERRALLAAFVNKKESNGDTPLHALAFNSSVGVDATQSIRTGETLIKYGADVNSLNGADRNPIYTAGAGFSYYAQQADKRSDVDPMVLKRALFNNLMAFVGLLVKSGANLHSKVIGDKEGHTSLAMITVMQHDHVKNEFLAKMNPGSFIAAYEQYTKSNGHAARAKAPEHKGKSSCIIL